MDEVTVVLFRHKTPGEGVGGFEWDPVAETARHRIRLSGVYDDPNYETYEYRFAPADLDRQAITDLIDADGWDEWPRDVSVQTIAAEAASWFENATRDDGSHFVMTRDGRPDWLTALIYDAHCDMFPDDWKYETIRDALEFIAECDDPDDGAGEFADSVVDVYTSDLFAWVQSNGYRVGYCDDAIDELGPPPGDSLVQRIALGQTCEAMEVYGLVLSSLEARLSELQS